MKLLFLACVLVCLYGLTPASGRSLNSTATAKPSNSTKTAEGKDAKFFYLGTTYGTSFWCNNSLFL